MSFGARLWLFVVLLVIVPMIGLAVVSFRPRRGIRRASIGFRAMGILDDAIRQHLELKRQHGAAEEELQRQEEEALGPARRDVAPAEGSGEDGQVELEDAPEEAAEAAPGPDGSPEAEAPDESPQTEPPDDPHEQATMLQQPPAQPDVAAPAGPDSIGVVQPEPEPAPVAEPEPLLEPDAPAPDDAAAEAPSFESAREEEPAPAAVQDEDADDFFVDDEPPAAAAEDEPPAEGEPELQSSDEDVLEDTPDFLQETPEHDRLWFEQKPPRDFDFD